MGPVREDKIRTEPYGARVVRTIFLKRALEQHRNSPHGVWSVINASVNHTPGPRSGCSRAVLNKNHSSSHGARTAPYEFCPLYGTRRVLIHAL